MNGREKIFEVANRHCDVERRGRGVEEFEN